MRNKYKNLQNRGQSPKGSSFVIPERRNQIITDTNINYISKNSFISTFEKKEFGEKLFNRNNDFDKKRLIINKDYSYQNKLDPDILQKNYNNTIKTSNHNVLISVYKKEPSISSIKTDSIPNINPSSNKNIIKVRNNNMNTIKSSINNSINNNNNNTITKNSLHNSKRILSTRINSQKSKSNLQDKKQFSGHKTYKKESNDQIRDKKNNIEFIEIKFGKNSENNKLIPNYRKTKNCASYNNINKNTEINIIKNDINKRKENIIIKPEITQKITNHNDYIHNYSSASNISSLNKPDNIKSITSNYCTTTERNNNKRKLINFRKIKNNNNNTNDDMSANSPTSSYILSPNNNTTKIKRKLTYRSKRATNKNTNDDKEKDSIINNNKDNNNKENNKDNNNIYKDISNLYKDINVNINNKSSSYLYKDINANLNNKSNTYLYKDINANINNKSSTYLYKDITANINNKSSTYLYKDINANINNKSNNYLYKDINVNINNKINNNLYKNNNVNFDDKSKKEDFNNNKDKNKNENKINVDNKDDIFNKDNKDDKDNNDNKENMSNKNIRKRKYVIKVAKTPDESNTHKFNDNDNKTEDINNKRKKIRHFLYFKANKEKEKKDNTENKEDKKEIDEFNLFTPKNIVNPTVAKSEIITSSPSFKKINNKIYKISPKHSFKDLLHEAKLNKNIQDSFSNIFQSCKSEIKSNQSNTVKSSDLNNSFSCFSNELELNLDNKNLLFNYLNSSNSINSSKNLFNSSNINTYKNNSATRNKNSNNKANSPNNIIYKKKMNLIKSISNHYKKNMGVFSPKFLLNSNSISSERKYNKFDVNPDKNDKNENSQYTNNISNNIINNNTYNTTLNIFKMNDISLKEIKNPNDIVVTKVNKNKNAEEDMETIKKQSTIDNNVDNKKHQRTNSDLNDMKSTLYFSVFNENNSSNNNINNNIINLNNSNSNNITNSNHKKNKSNISFADLTDLDNNNNNEINEFNIGGDENYKIDLEIIYILETKFKNILNKINNYMVCPNECFDLITYYFSSKFYEKEINIFKLKHNINNISYCIKLELLCYFLCYDVCFNKSFSQTGILLKTIFNLLYNNYLILISFILNDGSNNNITNEWAPKLKNIINNNLKINILPQEFNETHILSLISGNLKEVNNYYKMIIDNLYSHFYTNKSNKNNYSDSKYKFPHCLQLDLNDLDYYDKLNIISLFFFDAYRLINNYNFEDLKYFFDSFLQRIKFTNQKSPEKRSKSPKNKISDSKGASIKNVIIYKYNYNNGNFYYLPPMKKYYKYTLVLDLDETLVYLMAKNIYLNEIGKVGESKHTLIFRPGLLDFLKKMKSLYELVIFSFGTFDYVDSVIKIIEKNEKFFEYVLYRQHATINNGEYIKDLSLLGRDLKNIIIVDDIPQVFKMQERNGICIKAFYGDIVTDRNTLKILGKILERVRFDADEDGDIRISLDRQRNVILTHITNTLQ